MSTTTLTAPTARPRPVAAARVVLLALGAFIAAGGVIFGFVEDLDQTLADRLVGAWALAMGAATVVVAARLRADRPATVRAARALIGVHLAFTALKLVAYDETEALTFAAVDLVALALLRRA